MEDGLCVADPGVVGSPDDEAGTGQRRGPARVGDGSPRHCRACAARLQSGLGVVRAAKARECGVWGVGEGQQNAVVVEGVSRHNE
jgi:hypothetical protein